MTLPKESDSVPDIPPMNPPVGKGEADERRVDIAEEEAVPLTVPLPVLVTEP